MTTPDRSEVANAVSVAASSLWARQIRATDGQDGSFPGDNHGGPMYAGLTLATEAWLGVLTAADARDGTSWLLTQQREDGGFTGTPLPTDGPTVDATWCAVAGLEAAGDRSAHEAIRRAKAWLAGRPPGPFVSPLLAVSNPAWAPAYSLDWLAVPGARRWAWNRFHPWIVLAMVSASAAGQRLSSGTFRGLSGRYGEQKAIDLLLRTQNPCGSWTGAVLFTLQAIVALRLLGYESKSGTTPYRIRHALKWVGHWKRRGASGMEVMPFTADTWNTARSLRALLVAGTPPTDPGAGRAVRWLLANQVRRPALPEWQNPAPDAPRHGGWAYESTDLVSPDTDTTGAVLAALGALRTSDPEVDAAITRGRGWLGGLRNDDGGWPGFRRGSGSKPPGPLFLNPIANLDSLGGMARIVFACPPEMRDPSTEDLTGRVMVGLKACGAGADELAGAAAHLRAQQWRSRWFGRWDVNYQAGTAYALAGLATAGVDPDDPCIAHAVSWLEEKQNPDGGWGESIQTYTAPDSGPSPSRADLTGTVLLGLLGVGRRESRAVDRGVRFLLGALQDDGTWRGPTPLYIVQPPDEFYSNPVASLAAPLEALGAWLDS